MATHAEAIQAIGNLGSQHTAALAAAETVAAAHEACSDACFPHGRTRLEADPDNPGSTREVNNPPQGGVHQWHMQNAARAREHRPSDPPQAGEKILTWAEPVVNNKGEVIGMRHQGYDYNDIYEALRSDVLTIAADGTMTWNLLDEEPDDSNPAEE